MKQSIAWKNENTMVIQVLMILSAVVELLCLFFHAFDKEFCNMCMFFNSYVLILLIALYFLVAGINLHFLCFVFFACFFIFLMGQKMFVYFETGGYDEFLTFQFLKLDPDEYFIFAQLMYGTILFVFLGYQFGRKFFRKDTALSLQTSDAFAVAAEERRQDSLFRGYRRILWVLFVICFLCAFYMQLKIVIEKSDVSYTDGYLINVDVNALIKVGNYLFPGIAFLLLASRPKRWEMFIAILLFAIVEGGLQLLIGRRAVLASVVLFVVWYLVYYFGYHEKKMPLRYLFILILFALAGMLFFWFVEQVRSDSDESFSFFGAIRDFMVSTGGSDSVIANTIHRAEDFPKSGIVYLFNPIKEALFNNVLVRKLIEIFTGQAIPSLVQGEEYVQAHDSFSHWISYLVNSELYCNGYGMGTSFVAELYLAFCRIGVLFGSAAIGLLIFKLSKTNIRSLSVGSTALKMQLIYYLFTLPRSGLFDCATNLLYLLCAVLLFRVLCFAFGLRARKR